MIKRLLEEADMVGGLHNLWEQHGTMRAVLNNLELMNDLSLDEVWEVSNLGRLYREAQEAEDRLYALESEIEAENVPLWALEDEFDCD